MGIGYKTRWLAVALGIYVAAFGPFFVVGWGPLLQRLALPLLLIFAATLLGRWPNAGAALLILVSGWLGFFELFVVSDMLWHGNVPDLRMAGQLVLLTALDISLAQWVLREEVPQLDRATISGKTCFVIVIACIALIALTLLTGLFVVIPPLLLGALVAWRRPNVGNLLVAFGAVLVNGVFLYVCVFFLVNFPYKQNESKNFSMVKE